jgi:hypothetical protein
MNNWIVLGINVIASMLFFALYLIFTTPEFINVTIGSLPDMSEKTYDEEVKPNLKGRVFLGIIGAFGMWAFLILSMLVFRSA